MQVSFAQVIKIIRAPRRAKLATVGSSTLLDSTVKGVAYVKGVAALLMFFSHKCLQ